MTRLRATVTYSFEYEALSVNYDDVVKDASPEAMAQIDHMLIRGRELNIENERDVVREVQVEVVDG